MRGRGFSLVELLFVIGITVLLAAILFPVFASAQGKARQTVCTSNLRQLGIAVALYAQDYDDLFPRGGDPEDIRTNVWQNEAGGKYWAQAQQLPPLTTVISPYIGSSQVWHCPSDFGFPSSEDGDVRQLGDASPSSYANFGMSYAYAVTLYFERQTLAEAVMYDTALPHRQHGPSELILLWDAAGYWHGFGDFYDEQRYNALMVDGHVEVLSEGGLQQTDLSNRQFSLP